MDLVKTLSETMLSALPNFWKIASSFMDGKLKKVCSKTVYLCAASF